MLVLCACWLVFLVGPALANGGGYSTGGVSATGSIVGFTPSGTEAVQILEERLDIVLGPDAATVKVRYLLQNTTATDASVRFGFPVEELNANDLLNEDGSIEGPGSASDTSREKLLYCRDYRVQWNGKAVPAKFERQENVSIEADNDERRTGIRGWLISEITVPPGKALPLGIDYVSDYPTETIHVSDDEHSNAKIFRYRLSTGAVWAGPIGNGTVSVRAEGIRPEDVRILSPAGRFKRAEGGWQWSFRDLEPTLADDLVIEAAPDEHTYGYRHPQGSNYTGDEEGYKRVDFVQRGDRWFVRHSNFAKVTASSVLPPQKENTYEADNVADESGETVWAEGARGSGAGEWIEVEPEVPKPLDSLTIAGGYQKDTDLFRHNARPKRLEILLNGEHRFTADLPDAEGSTVIPVLGYDKPAEKVRVTIREVYPGEKWQDCVITALALTSALDKAPDVSPAR